MKDKIITGFAFALMVAGFIGMASGIYLKMFGIVIPSLALILTMGGLIQKKSNKL